MPQKKASPDLPVDPSTELRAKRRDLLQQLARQAEERRHQVRQMLNQSAESREKEAAELRDSRFETLKKISADVTQSRSDARAHLEQLAQEKSDRYDRPTPAPAASSVAPRGSRPAPMPNASQPARRWQPGQWQPGQWQPGQWQPGQKSSPAPNPQPVAAKPAAPPPPVAPARPPVSEFSIAAIAPKPPATPPAAPAAPPPAVPASISNAALDNRVVALEDRYSRLLAALQDQLDLTAKWDELASRLEQDFSTRTEQRITEESARTSEALTAQWQSDLAAALDRLSAANTSPAATVELVENLASQFQSFADEMISRLTACEAQATACQSQQRRIEKLEVMLAEHVAAMQTRPVELAGLESRLARLESSRPAPTLAAPPAPEDMHSRMGRIENGVKELLQSIENQAPAPRPVPPPEPPSPSQLLSNLSRMVSELKDAQAERQAAVRQDANDLHN